jgi:CTP synthase (UTP-ammonia lyase)
MKRTLIGIIGDFKENKHTHLALDACLEHCAPHFNHVAFEWLPTYRLSAVIPNAYEGYWIAPGSPYNNDEAVYKMIEWSRENNHIMLGTCGGFQYMMVEYARNVLNIKGAGHEESEPDAKKLIIAKMVCSLKASTEDVVISDRDSWLYHVLGTDRFTAGYNCAYGLNPAFQEKFNRHPFIITAHSDKGEARAFELKDHLFFRGTLFQPPLTSTPDKPNPLIMDFIRTCKES